jgi:hypothetical protein
MKNVFSIITLMLLTVTLNAQFIYNDFDGNQNVDFAGWPNAPVIVANPDVSGINTSANVAEWNRSTEQWAHVYAELDGFVDFTTGTSFQLKVYSPIACEVLFKLEGSGGANTEVMGNVTTPNVWEQLEYDFTGAQSGVYNKIVIFFDFATGVENTFYFDDIVGPEYGGSVPGEPVVLPVTFDDPEVNYALTDFGGNISEIIVDPLDPANNIVQTIKTEVAELWAGTTVGGSVGFAEPIPFAVGSTFMSVAIWSPTAGTPIRLKVEDSTNPTISVETETLTTVAEEWEILVFDFSNEAPGTAPLNLDNTYNKASIFFNFGTTGAQAGEQTYFWDDMEFVGDPVIPLVLPVTFDDPQVNYDLVDFGGNLSEIIVDPLNAANNIVQTIKTETAELWAGTTVGGTNGFAEPIPFAAGSTLMSVAIWSPTAGTPIRLKVEDSTNPTISVETETLTTVASEWEILVFDFSNEAPGTAPLNLDNTYNKASIFFNFGTTGAQAGEQTYFWDDMEFVGGPGPKPLLALDVQDNFENDGWGTITTWMFQDPDLVDLTIVEDPVNAANHVAEYNRSGSFEWTNVQFILDHRMDLSERNVFDMSVYFPSSNNYTGALTPTAAIKLQNSLLGGMAWSTQTEVKLDVLVFDEWVTLSFDFSSIADSVNYDQVVVQLGGEGHLEPGLFYFDNFELLPTTVGTTQSFSLDLGYQFVSSYVAEENMDMLVLLEDILTENLAYVRDSDGGMLRKIGPNWINGIGDWTSTEGYLFKVFGPETFAFEGNLVPDNTPIFIPTGFRFVSYLPITPMDAITAFETIIGDDLAYIRDSDGNMLRKIGPVWVNGIGDANPGEGYLVKMLNPGTLIYTGGSPSPVIEDFEGDPPVFTVFGGIADIEIVPNPDPTGANTTNTSAKMIKTAGAEVWAGCFFEIAEPLDFDTYSNVIVKTWSPVSGIVIKLKLENADASITHEVDITNTVAVGWEVLEYDFSGAPAADYVRIVIFFDFGNYGDGTEYYFDEFELSTGVKSSILNSNATHFNFNGGNAADPVYTIYVKGLEIGDELAAYDEDVLVGATKITSDNELFNALPVFSTVTVGQGYVAGNPIILKVYNAKTNELVSVDFEMESIYDSYNENVYPSNDGEFSVVNITKSSVADDLSLSIYPNPANGIVNINSLTDIDRVMIFNCTGQIVYDELVNNNFITINTESFKQGLYIIRVETSDGLKTEKLTIK